MHAPRLQARFRGALILMAFFLPIVRAWSVSSGPIVELRTVQRPQTCEGGRGVRMVSNGDAAEGAVSRQHFLGLALGGFSAVALSGLTPVSAAEEEFTVAFNASKGSLGIGLQELRYPKKKAPWDKQMEVVTVSSVDPYGQGVKQDKRIRPGLVITRVQGRGVEGLTAKEVIKQLEDEMLARSAGEARVAEEEGLPELVEISFSTKCISTPEEPEYCYNSVQPLDSVIGEPDLELR